MSKCGCDTRKETIGSGPWWSGVLFASGATMVLLTHGGNVTTQTKKILIIGATGAILAIMSEEFVKPLMGVK